MLLRQGKDHQLRSPSTFDGVINLVNELSEGCSDIYKFLIDRDQLKSSFAKDQIEEERIKAKIIKANNENEEVIFAVEDTNFLQGRIEFALDCINYDGVANNFNKDSLTEIKNVIIDYFND